MSKRKSNSVSSGKSSKIYVSLSKVFSATGVHTVRSCPQCGNTTIAELKEGRFSCFACKWKGSDIVWKCANSSSDIELINLLSKARVQKDVIKQAVKAGIRVPVELLAVQGVQ